MDESDRKKYLIENKHAHGDDFSPVIHLGEEHPDTWYYRSLDYMNEKTGDFFYNFKVAIRPRRKLTVKETLVFVSIFILVVLVNAALFSFILSFKKQYPSVIAFGDIMLDRGIRNIVKKGVDPFENIKQNRAILSKYDMVIANLEGPIIDTDRLNCQQKAYSFQFPIDSAVRIKEAGIQMLNLANNHSYDCYRKGEDSTIDYLTKSGLSYIGVDNLEKSYTIKTIDNKKIAFVGIDQTIMPIPLSKFYPLVKKLKLENDFVVVYIHWGTEYLLTADKNQVDIGHKLIDNGADIVFGSHPHVVEPVEIYKNRPIFYSLGNFVFDQDFGDTTIGLGAGVEFQKNIIAVTLYPFNIVKFKPVLMSDAVASNTCDKLLSEVENQGCNFEIKI